MLVLTRKLQEKIQIADSITITVLRVKGNSVRLGIEAPRSVRVVRSELPPEDRDMEIAVDVGTREPDQTADICEGLSPADESANPEDRIGELLPVFQKAPLAPKILRLATVGVS